MLSLPILAESFERIFPRVFFLREPGPSPGALYAVDYDPRSSVTRFTPVFPRRVFSAKNPILLVTAVLFLFLSLFPSSDLSWCCLFFFFSFSEPQFDLVDSYTLYRYWFEGLLSYLTKPPLADLLAPYFSFFFRRRMCSSQDFFCRDFFCLWLPTSARRSDFVPAVPCWR